MPRYIYENENGEQIEFESDEELEIEDEEGEESDDEDDSDDESEDGDEDADEGDEDDEDNEADDDNSPEEFERVEAVFRKEKVAIRANSDIAQLTGLRRSYESSLAEGKLSQIAQTRSRDLVELIERRISDIKARRLAERGR